MEAPVEAVAIAEYETLGPVIVDLTDFTELPDDTPIPWEHFDHRPRTGADIMDTKLGDLIEDDSVLIPVLMSQQLKREQLAEDNGVQSQHDASNETNPLQ